jgi:TetR/AcrR family transcriptional regulator, cholesterol catabolism regulator
MSDPAATQSIKSEVAALKRNRILTAASELFYEQGYENTTLDAIGERLGVTKPFIYSHFGSKAEILAVICAQGISQSQEALDSVLPLTLSPVDKLRELARRFVLAVLTSQMQIAIFTREEKHLSAADFERINVMRRDFDRKLTALLRDGVGSGDFRLRDPHIAALSIGGMVSWAYVWYRPGGRLNLDVVADEMAALILAMAGVPPECG